MRRDCACLVRSSASSGPNWRWRWLDQYDETARTQLRTGWADAPARAAKARPALFDGRASSAATTRWPMRPVPEELRDAIRAAPRGPAGGGHRPVRRGRRPQPQLAGRGGTLIGEGAPRLVAVFRSDSGAELLPHLRQWRAAKRTATCCWCVAPGRPAGGRLRHAADAAGVARPAGGRAIHGESARQGRRRGRLPRQPGVGACDRSPAPTGTWSPRSTAARPDRCAWLGGLDRRQLALFVIGACTLIPRERRATAAAQARARLHEERLAPAAADVQSDRRRQRRRHLREGPGPLPGVQPHCA